MALRIEYVGWAVEVNFVIKKFNELPTALRRLIYEELKAGVDENELKFSLAAFALCEMLTNAAPKELVQFVNQSLDTHITNWFIDPGTRVQRSRALADHLLEAATLDETLPMPEQLTVSPIDLNTL